MSRHADDEEKQAKLESRVEMRLTVVHFTFSRQKENIELVEFCFNFSRGFNDDDRK